MASAVDRIVTHADARLRTAASERRAPITPAVRAERLRRQFRRFPEAELRRRIATAAGSG
jgi:hypothetical protein